MTHLLIVDDNKDFREFLVDKLSRDAQVRAFSNAEDAFNYVLDNQPDVALLDMKLPKMSGMELFQKIKEVSPSTEVILLTGFNNVDNAIQAMQLGAFDYLSKPCRINELRLILHRAAERRKLLRENLTLKQTLSRNQGGRSIIGRSKSIQSLLKLIDKTAQSNSTVLVQGESGSGKELAAQEIHRRSPRKDGPYIVVDCSTLQENLLENELFGHERGAFTDAGKEKQGLFELADGGTIFLDEIGEMGKGLQAKILRVLETGEFRRLGGMRSIKSDLRVVAATNRNLEAEVNKGNFRQDLFYRLNTLMVRVPPLRERTEDIAELARHFLSKLDVTGARKKSLSEGALQKLLQYPWPGNVRELANVIERAVILSETPLIEPDDIQISVSPRVSGKIEREADSAGSVPLEENAGDGGLDSQVQKAERDTIIQTLCDCRYRITETAKTLKISRQRLYRKMEKLGIKLP